jgi:uncharacterized protein (TIGR03067 family)
MDACKEVSHCVHTQFGLLGLILILVWAHSTDAQTYRSVDPSGRVHYSDTPPAENGTKTRALKGMTPAIAINELQGEWVVASATINGEPLLQNDGMIGAGALWTFRGSELVALSSQNETQRYATERQPAASPKSMLLVPDPTSRQRAIEIIYERTGDLVRVAYSEDPRQPPTSFEPRRKLVVLNLTAKAAARGPGYANAGAGRDACSILDRAGARELLGGEAAVMPQRGPPSDAVCRLAGRGVEAVLFLSPVSSRQALDSERAKQERDVKILAVRGAVQDEPILGDGAFSVLQGNSTLVMALKGDVLIGMRFAYPVGNHARLVQFAQRVRSAL